MLEQLDDDVLLTVLGHAGCAETLAVATVSVELDIQVRRILESLDCAPWSVPVDSLGALFRRLLKWRCPMLMRGRKRVDFVMLSEMLLRPPAKEFRIDSRIYTADAAVWHLQLTKTPVTRLNIDLSRFCPRDANYVLQAAIEFCARCKPRSVRFRDDFHFQRVPRALIRCAVDALEVSQLVPLTNPYLRAMLANVHPRLKVLHLRSPYPVDTPFGVKNLLPLRLEMGTIVRGNRVIRLPLVRRA